MSITDLQKPRVTVVLSLGVVAIYLALAMPQVGEPFVIDEMEFPRLAEAVADTGRPVYYRGEQTPHQIGAFHPPLYGYALGGWIAVFGFSEETVRLFGVILMIATAFVGVRIVDMSGLARTWGPPVFLSLFLLHPFVIQSALLPDIDGTLLLFATLLVFYEALRVTSRNEGVMVSGLRLGLTLALVLAAKLTSVMILPVVFMGILLGQGVKRAITVTGLATLIGSAAFLASWLVLSSIARLPFAYPFEFTIASGLKGGAADRDIGELLGQLIPAPWTRYWVGLLLPILAAVGTGFLIAQRNSRAERRPLLMLALWSIGTLALYSVITGPPFGFPKYYIAALPTMAILGVVAVERVLDRLPLRRPVVLSGLILLVGMAAIFLWRFAQTPLDGEYRWPGYVWTIALVALGALALTTVVANGRSQITTTIIAALFIAATAYNISMAVVHTADTRSVRYFPGEVGFIETVEYLQSRVEPDDLVLAPKDIGSATYNHYHEQERLFRQLPRLAHYLDDESVEYAVVRSKWDYSYLVFPEVEPIIEKEMDLVETIGDFLIYQRTD